MQRRTLLASAGLATLSSCTPPARSGFDPHDWRSVREQFAIDPALAHLAVFVFASHPAPVRSAIDTHRAGLDRDPISYVHTNQERLESAVAAAASDYLGTPTGRIAFTDSTT